MTWRSLARRWPDLDDHPPHGEQATLEAQSEADLPAWTEPLQFGTAGLRGELGPGPGRMNGPVVRRLARALHRGWEPGLVVVGYDARRLSREMAWEAAQTFRAEGRPVLLADGPLPTPLLAATVPRAGAVGGVMITASHNPPQDNGAKVYTAQGAQILPEEAESIAARIQDAPWDRPGQAQAPLDPRSTSWRELWQEAWFADLLAQRVHPAPAPGLSMVYTALHGVGYQPLRELLRRAGHAELIPVAEQVAPDGAFPTVAFPNPEEPGALDRALAKATEVGADLVLANDPDADRLAVAVATSGGFRRLTGDETGLLLASDLLAFGPTDRPRLVATTLVSSSALSRLAAREGVACAVTLTGFKWIGAVALRHEAEGGRFVLGYEEALGYCAGSAVRDKDGVGAALLLADLAAYERSRGRTLLDTLADLQRRLGVFVTTAASLRLDDPSSGPAREQLSRWRARPPRELAGRTVVRALDLASGEGRDLDADDRYRLDFPPTDLWVAEFADGGRLLIRPSGTEPKLKLYLEVVAAVPAGGAPGPVEAAARAEAEALRQAVLFALTSGG